MRRVLSLSPDAVFCNASGMITMEDPVRLDRALTAMAVKDGRIIALGPDAGLRQMAEGAEVVDLQGAVVMPGLIDCHNHFLSTALGWDRVQLAKATSIGELLEAIAQRVQETPPGQWVLCASRWHETNLAERRMPTAEELDCVAPNHPVYLPRGGHVVVTNTQGLQMAGYFCPTPADVKSAESRIASRTERLVHAGRPCPGEVYLVFWWACGGLWWLERRS